MIRVSHTMSRFMHALEINITNNMVSIGRCLGFPSQPLLLFIPDVSLWNVIIRNSLHLMLCKKLTLGMFIRFSIEYYNISLKRIVLYWLNLLLNKSIIVREWSLLQFTFHWRTSCISYFFVYIIYFLNWRVAQIQHFRWQEMFFLGSNSSHSISLQMSV